MSRERENNLSCRVGLLSCMYFSEIMDTWRFLFFAAGRGHLEETWEYSLGKACSSQILSPVDQYISEGYMPCAVALCMFVMWD